ncbi:MAG: OmpA family protein [Alphaproteobacteria bacterium]|nr:OmpA family protein [Alphaproteobacteria bacterium]MCB9696297.1 OmpA family protein [Alphaproteobacteria bacterium]
MTTRGRANLGRYGQGALVALSLAVSGDALAQQFAEGPPYSIDIEFVRPQFGSSSFAGVDAAMANRNLTWRLGALWQYEQNPLTLYEGLTNQELGPVVANRWQQTYGASLDVQRVTFGLAIPMSYDWDSDGTQVAFSAPGYKLGDIGGTVRVLVIRTPNDVFNVGGRVGLTLPTGAQNAYSGEGAIRFTGAALVALNLGPLTVASDFGLMSRATRETREDFVAASEVQWGNALRLKLPDATRVGVNAQLLSRSVLEQFLQGGAENSLEALGGLEVYPSRRTTVSLGAGRGLTSGYGTTDFRIFTGVMVEVPPREPLPPTYVLEEPPTPIAEIPPEVDVIIEEPTEPVFEEGEIIQKLKDRIYIRDMVEFVVDTNTIMDKSLPTLQAVADLVNADPYIANLVIEGHASQEGSYEHNYKLAESRARAIWEKLMEYGVAEDRIAYRGLGEVKPIQEGEDEEALQKNRRVEFHITRQFDSPDQMPDYPDFQTLPWNGTIVKVVQPEKPEAEPVEEPPKGPKLDEFGLPIDEEE